MEAQVDTFASLCNHRKNYNQNSKGSNTQNHQKIELYGSPTIKDLKKTHSPKWVGGVESGKKNGEAVWWGKAAAEVMVECMVPYSYVVVKNWEGYPGSKRSWPQARLQSPGFQHQEDKPPLPLAIKTSECWGSGRNCQIFTTYRVRMVLKHMQTPGQQLEGRQSHTGSG